MRSHFWGVTHEHQCWVCMDHWVHDAIDEGCEDVKMRSCPIHEGDAEDYEPWYVRRRGLLG